MKIFAITVFVIVAMVVLWTIVRFLRQRRATHAWLRAGSQVMDTRMGPVEYAVVGDDGPTVLMLHGGLGGWDQGVALGVDLLARPGESTEYRRAIEEGASLFARPFRLIAPTRVGYLRTPLTTGRTPAECADAIDALLDELDVDDVVVIGVSGGGPTALQSLLRHPTRTRCLAMVCAIPKYHVQPDRTRNSFVGRTLFSGIGRVLFDFFGWVMLGVTRRYPAWTLKQLLKATETFEASRIAERVTEIMQKPEQVRWMQGLIESLTPAGARQVGLHNDLAQYEAIEAYPVEQITCPTLVVHGRHEGNVPFDHAEFVAKGVPGAELFVVEGCGHLIWLSDHVEEVRRRLVGFAG